MCVSLWSQGPLTLEQKSTIGATPLGHKKAIASEHFVVAEMHKVHCAIIIYIYNIILVSQLNLIKSASECQHLSQQTQRWLASNEKSAFVYLDLVSKMTQNSWTTTVTKNYSAQSSESGDESDEATMHQSSST